MTITTPPSGTGSGAAPSGELVVIGRIPRAAAIAAAVAVVVNVIIRAIGVGPLDVSSDFDPLSSVGAAVISTILGVVGGAVVLWLLARSTAQPLRNFWFVAGAVLLFSLLGPVSLGSEPGGDATSVTVLIAMHLATATIVVGVFTALTRE